MDIAPLGLLESHPFWIMFKKIHGILHAPKLITSVLDLFADANKILLIYLFHVKSYMKQGYLRWLLSFLLTRRHLISPALTSRFLRKNNQNNLELLQPHCFLSVIESVVSNLWTKPPGLAENSSLEVGHSQVPLRHIHPFYQSTHSFLEEGFSVCMDPHPFYCSLKSNGET